MFSGGAPARARPPPLWAPWAPRCGELGAGAPRREGTPDGGMGAADPRLQTTGGGIAGETATKSAYGGGSPHSWGS